LDKDSNGRLSKAELKEALGETMDATQIFQVLGDVDASKDGMVDEDEFIAAVAH
jgi:Ca2+-binding EF-hand superfamily protein